MPLPIFDARGTVNISGNTFDVIAKDKLGTAHVSGIKGLQSVVSFRGQCRHTQTVDHETTTIVKAEDGTGMRAQLSGSFVTHDIHGKSFWVKVDPNGTVSIFNGDLARV